MPDELRPFFAYPQTYMVGPEVAIGQSDIRLGYDPAEVGAKTSPLGHEYEQPQDGSGNAWGGWYRLLPTRQGRGLPADLRLQLADAGLPPRLARDHAEAKDDVTLPEGKPLPVMYAGSEWLLHVDGKPADASEGKFPARHAADLGASRRLGGAHAHGRTDRLSLAQGKKFGGIELFYQPGKATFARGDSIAYRVAFAGGSSRADHRPDLGLRRGLRGPDARQDGLLARG